MDKEEWRRLPGSDLIDEIDQRRREYIFLAGGEPEGMLGCFFETMDIAISMKKQKSYLPHQLRYIAKQCQLATYTIIHDIERSDRGEGSWKILEEVLIRGLRRLDKFLELNPESGLTLLRYDMAIGIQRLHEAVEYEKNTRDGPAFGK